MDYNLAALKLLCGQLKDIRESPSQNTFTLGCILFQRAWLQGVLISSDNDDYMFLDDGTGIVELSFSGSGDFLHRQWKKGMYVMVVGGYLVRTGDLGLVKVHKIVDLSNHPNREAMWYLEVMEAYKNFYKPLIEGFI